MEGLDYLGSEDPPATGAVRAADVHPLDAEDAALRAADAEIARNEYTVPVLLGATMAVGLACGAPLIASAAMLILFAYGSKKRDTDVERLLGTVAADQSPTLVNARRQLAAARIKQIEQQTDDLTVMAILRDSGTVETDRIAEATGLETNRVILSLNRLEEHGTVCTSENVGGTRDIARDVAPRSLPPKGRPTLKLLPGGKDDL